MYKFGQCRWSHRSVRRSCWTSKVRNLQGRFGRFRNRQCMNSDDLEPRNRSYFSTLRKNQKLLVKEWTVSSTALESSSLDEKRITKDFGSRGTTVDGVR